VACGAFRKVTNLEAGRRAASLDLIVQIAAFFSISTDYLLRDDVPVSPIAAHRVAWPSLPTPPLAYFGHRLRDIRRRQNLTQTALTSQLSSYSQAHMSLLETGRSEPSPELVIELAATLGVSSDELLCEGASGNR